MPEPIKYLIQLQCFFVLFLFCLLRQSMKNELPICDKRLKMKWNSPPQQEWEINSYLVLPVCSLFSRDTEIYANCDNAWMAAGTVLHCVWCVDPYACVQTVTKKKTKQLCILVCTSHHTQQGFQKCKTCKSGLGTVKWKRAGDVWCQNT